MAVSFLGAFVEANDTTIDTDAVTHTLVAGNNRIVIIIIPTRDTAAHGISVVTYGGQAATLAVENEAGGDGIASYIYYVLEADLPADGANNAFVVFNGAVQGLGVGCYAIQDANQGAPEDTGSDVGSDAGASLNLTITAGSFQADCFSHRGTGGTFTWGAGQVERWDENNGGVHRIGASTQEGASPGSETMSATSTVGNFHVYVAASFARSGISPTPGVATATGVAPTTIHTALPSVGVATATGVVPTVIHKAIAAAGALLAVGEAAVVKYIKLLLARAKTTKFLAVAKTLTMKAKKKTLGFYARRKR